MKLGKQMSVTEQLQLMKQPIVEKCTEGEKSCSKIVVEGGKSFCKSYAFPAAKWRNGICNMADHIVIEVKKDTKVRVGQQKQKKKL
jgi:hypothetical protein